MTERPRSTLTLARLLGSERDPEARVAWRGDAVGKVEVSWREFCADVAALRAQLAPLPPGGVALYTTDSYRFAIGLFAIWHADRVAVCPPNAQPGALAGLAKRVIAAVSDGSAPVPGRPLLSPGSSPAARAESSALPTLDPNRAVVELFTSGTTGRGKAIAKSLGHLEHEVQILDEMFGERIAGAPTIASASHQHLYGMLFRVLWPLAAGRCFHAGTFLHAEELVARMSANGPCVFASVPAHLKRLAERGGLAALGGHCSLVFSSGGPLDADTAARWEGVVGSAPVEVFGSTESGGVAWRLQGGGQKDEAWTPFPTVRVAQDGVDGRLLVRSPSVSEGEEGAGFLLGDRVRLLDDGRFRLLGRADRVLKIGEKRISLPDMEACLLDHASIERVALLPLAQRGESRVGAVVVLSKEGRRQLAQEGARALGLKLAETLAHQWDRVLLPRAWRFVPALPEDAQGKVTQPGLSGLFRGAPAHPRPSSEALRS